MNNEPVVRSTAGADEELDLVRWLADWMADVASNPEPHPVTHPGGCGERVDPPCGNADLAPFRAGERLRSGTVLCHRCGKSFRPHELVQAEHCSRRALS